MSIDAIQAANQAFYDAFESLQADEMASLWLDSDVVRCVHPGWRSVVGREQVMASWSAIFKNTDSMQFILTEVQISQEGDVGMVTCIENIMAGVGEAERMGAVQATNMFLKSDGEWKMVLHHASPIAHETPHE